MNHRTADFRRKASLRIRKRLLGVALVATAACVAVLALLLEPEEVLAARSPASDTVARARLAPPVVSRPAPAAVARRVYPYSIIPGGVSGRDELARVIKADKVVAAHYASFDVDNAVNTTVSKPRAVYVSYRKGDQVYWTARKLMLAKGETLLTDGRSEMRARCANRISDQPQFPVEPDAPSAGELDSVVAVSMDLRGLGLGDPEFVGAGSMTGFGVALASSEQPLNSKAAGASRGGVSIGHATPRNSRSGSADGSPVSVAPSQNQGGDNDNTPVEPATPGGKPSTGLPERPALTPGGSTMPGHGDTPPIPPAPPGNIPPLDGAPPAGNPHPPFPPIVYPNPPEWPPGTLPPKPDEDVHEVPEPSTLWLSAAAFAAMLLLRRKAKSLCCN